MGSTSSIHHGAHSDPSIRDMDIQHKVKKKKNLQCSSNYSVFSGIGNVDLLIHGHGTSKII
jgi:hypothetical protein